MLNGKGWGWNGVPVERLNYICLVVGMLNFVFHEWEPTGTTRKAE